MAIQKHIKIGRLTALISFLLGTFIFLLYFQTSSSILLFVGYGYILLAGLINLGVFYSILTKAINDKVNRKKLLKTCGLILINIPIMILYCWIVIILLNTMRITFTNSTKATLTNINIVGGGGGHIDKLEVGESETVWIEIITDGSINIEYISNGKSKKESVVGYITNNMGDKMDHKIGEKNKTMFY